MCGLADWVRQCLVEFVFTVQPDPPVAAPSRAGPPEVVAQTAYPPVIAPHGADPPVTAPSGAVPPVIFFGA